MERSLLLLAFLVLQDLILITGFKCLCGHSDDYGHGKLHFKKDHCQAADESEKEFVCLSHGVCYGVCETDGYCFKSIKNNVYSIKRSYRCEPMPVVSNMQPTNCLNTDPSEKTYMVECCNSTFCNSVPFSNSNIRPEFFIIKGSVRPLGYRMNGFDLAPQHVVYYCMEKAELRSKVRSF